MARVIDCADEEAIELGAVVEALDQGGFDPRDDDSFAAAAPLLKRLANNRSFLTDIALDELKNRCRRQSAESRYSAQVLVLHRVSEKFLLRANFWPSERDSVMKSSGTAPFFYHVPHDHNFSFLTVGYLGPGYWSEYYEYDYGDVVGFPGEKVDLRFIERSRLEQGKVMLYRAHRDVHDQLPADELSVSINIMEASPRQPFLSQYRFDVKKCEVAAILTTSSTEALLALAAHHGGGNARDLVQSFADSHPCDRIQMSALRSLASIRDFDDGLALFERGTASPNRFVATMSKLELANRQRHRRWIEGNAPIAFSRPAAAATPGDR